MKLAIVLATLWFTAPWQEARPDSCSGGAELRDLSHVDIRIMSGHTFAGFPRWRRWLKVYVQPGVRYGVYVPNNSTVQISASDSTGNRGCWSEVIVP